MKVTFVSRKINSFGKAGGGIIDGNRIDGRNGTTFIPYLAAKLVAGRGIRMTGNNAVLILGKMGRVRGFGKIENGIKNVGKFFLGQPGMRTAIGGIGAAFVPAFVKPGGGNSFFVRIVWPAGLIATFGIPNLGSGMTR